MIREEGGAIVRLGDGPTVLGSKTTASVRINGESATFMGIFVSPNANSLDVIADARTVGQRDRAAAARGMVAHPYDSTEAIRTRSTRW